MSSALRLFIDPPALLSLSVAAGVSLIALRLGMLSRSGAVAAALIGGTIFTAGGGWFALLLLTFFFSSALLSRWRASPASARSGAGRTAAQVVANGGVAAGIALIYRIGVARQPWAASHMLMLLYLAAVATATADSWSTEVGRASTVLPRSLRDGTPTAPGTSGAITFIGTGAGLLGAIFIAAVGYIVWPLDIADALVVVWAGWLGSLADSILGATVQAQYREVATGVVRDVPDGAPLVQGFRWLSNDGVNFAATLAGVGLAWLLAHFGPTGR